MKESSSSSSARPKSATKRRDEGAHGVDIQKYSTVSLLLLFFPLSLTFCSMIFLSLISFPTPHLFYSSLCLSLPVTPLLLSPSLPALSFSFSIPLTTCPYSLIFFFLGARHVSFLPFISLYFFLSLSTFIYSSLSLNLSPHIPSIISITLTQTS